VLQVGGHALGMRGDVNSLLHTPMADGAGSFGSQTNLGGLVE